MKTNWPSNVTPCHVMSIAQASYTCHLPSPKDAVTASSKNGLAPPNLCPASQPPARPVRDQNPSQPGTRTAGQTILPELFFLPHPTDFPAQTTTTTTFLSSAIHPNWPPHAANRSRNLRLRRFSSSSSPNVSNNRRCCCRRLPPTIQDGLFARSPHAPLPGHAPRWPPLREHRRQQGPAGSLQGHQRCWPCSFRCCSRCRQCSQQGWWPHRSPHWLRSGYVFLCRLPSAASRSRHRLHRP